jgi:hypothetical protein
VEWERDVEAVVSALIVEFAAVFSTTERRDRNDASSVAFV